MTDACVLHTTIADGGAAGTALGHDLNARLPRPHAVLLFISPSYDIPAFVEAFRQAAQPQLLVGCSSAGEFTSHNQDVGSACAVAISSTDMSFAASVSSGVKAAEGKVGDRLAAGFRGLTDTEYPYRSAMVLTDALGGYVETLIDDLNRATGGNYQFFGGGAGDDARFQKTYVIFNDQVISDAVVALELLSYKPLGLGVSHGWEPATPDMRVTQATASAVHSMNAVPSVEVFAEHAQATGQAFDQKDPLPFFLHNLLGVGSDQGYKLRVPLAVGDDGAVMCAAEVPTGSRVRIMATNPKAAAEAAQTAAAHAVAQLSGLRPKVALFFDCVATRLRLGEEFKTELASVQEALGTTEFAGFNSYGQIARTEGQFNGFHNCTAVVCVIPE